MPRGDLPTGVPSSLRWRTSSFSGEGNCVEVASDGVNVLLRDSKNPAGPRLTLTPGAWTAFLAAIRDGEFNPAS